MCILPRNLCVYLQRAVSHLNLDSSHANHTTPKFKVDVSFLFFILSEVLWRGARTPRLATTKSKPVSGTSGRENRDGVVMAYPAIAYRRLKRIYIWGLFWICFAYYARKGYRMLSTSASLTKFDVSHPIGTYLLASPVFVNQNGNFQILKQFCCTCSGCVNKKTRHM